MKKFNVKQKLNATVDHVKAHPTAYAVGATIATCTITSMVYDYYRSVVSLDDVAAQMVKTGKGLYFHNKKTGQTIITLLFTPTNS